MTVDDAFDAKLKAAFADAQPAPDEAFAERVAARVSGGGRRRVLILGGAGAGGSTIASTQLEALFEHIEPAAGATNLLGDGAALLAYVSPEMLAAVTLAAMVGALALVLPSRP